MAGKNIFSEPFDEGTKVKLELFESYLKEWLPVFVSKPNPIWRNVQIFDFFSGEGKDKDGVLGSPLIILKIVNSLIPYIKSNKINLRIVLNDPNCYETLKKNIEEFGVMGDYQVEIHKEEFKNLFQANYSLMKGAANFIFFDQNGIKEITKEIFEQVIQLRVTDFLFFISSSFFKRFSETKEFKNYFNFSSEEIRNWNYYHIHRKVLQHYKGLIPNDKQYFLAPFSIRKSTNIYGLIFGTNHTLGIEKFLTVAWKLDNQRGEANYDIDGEKISSNKPFLFEALNTPKKRQVFENSLESKILKGELKSQLDAYYFTLEEGFQLKDTNEILKKLQGQGRINTTFKLISQNLHKEINSITLLKS